MELGDEGNQLGIEYAPAMGLTGASCLTQRTVKLLKVAGREDANPFLLTLSFEEELAPYLKRAIMVMVPSEYRPVSIKVKKWEELVKRWGI